METFDKNKALALMKEGARAIHTLSADFRAMCDLLNQLVDWQADDAAIAEHHNLNIADVLRLRAMLEDK